MAEPKEKKDDAKRTDVRTAIVPPGDRKAVVYPKQPGPPRPK